MTILHAIILGAVQGLTEFIPVSSTGHLIAIPKLLHWDDGGLTFDAVLHIGTLAALVIYYWRDWAGILSSFAKRIAGNRPYSKDQDPGRSGRLLVPIIVACIPAALVGLAFKHAIEGILREWYVVAGALVVFGLLMLAGERYGRKQRDIGSMNYVDYIGIGCAQALAALLPGASRSGLTITAGLFRNMGREAAARFSFLLSMPVVFGAGLFAAKDLMNAGLKPGELPMLACGTISAALFGVIAIHFLLRFLRTRPVTVFVLYRICLAAVLVAVFMRG